MTAVETVLGPVDVRKLGWAYSHEHVIVSEGVESIYYPWRYDFAATESLAAQRWAEVKRAGVSSCIDLTTPDLGRDIPMVQRVARQAGIHVVAATGIWRTIPRTWWNADPDEISAVFVREIEAGIGETGVKAGAIKMANDSEGVTPEATPSLRAAARALKATGCPISTHSYAPGKVGLQQIEVFRSEGAPMDRIAIGHSDDTTDLDYLVSILDAGCYLSMDRFDPGEWPGYPTWRERANTVAALVERGWAHRVMLGHDFPPDFVPAGSPAPKAANPYLFVPAVVLPELNELGVTEEQVDTMMRRVPAEFLTGERID